ncbi:2'-5' RNA ligase family protein [Candidatus Poribacteria bacterium]|nr:2'-5' RNA ligase family protein [Candidatus Poribacteria bacterium]
MPTKTHTTAVVLIPPETIQSPIQDIRKIHDRSYIRWMPHITMLYPFAPTTEFPDVIDTLEKSAKQNSAFTVTLATFYAFKHRKSSTMFLAPEPDNNIKKLHKTLINNLPDYDDTARFPNGFTPHLSVGQFQHKTLIQEQERLQSNWKPIQFTVDSIFLIYRSQETDDRFVVAEDFRLTPFKDIENI